MRSWLLAYSPSKLKVSSFLGSTLPSRSKMGYSFLEKKMPASLVKILKKSSPVPACGASRPYLSPGHAGVCFVPLSGCP